MALDVTEQEIVVTRGEDAVVPFAGVVVSSLAGVSLEFSVATRRGKTVLLLLTSSDGIDGQTVGGAFNLVISPARTKAFKAGVYRWDLWRLGADRPIAGGTFRVLEPVRALPP